jgi:hypothetical protein
MNAPYRELAAIPKTLKSEIELALEEGTRKHEEYLESLQRIKNKETDYKTKYASVFKEIKRFDEKSEKIIKKLPDLFKSKEFIQKGYAVISLPHNNYLFNILKDKIHSSGIEIDNSVLVSHQNSSLFESKYWKQVLSPSCIYEWRFSKRNSTTKDPIEYCSNCTCCDLPVFFLERVNDERDFFCLKCLKSQGYLS